MRTHSHLSEGKAFLSSHRLPALPGALPDAQPRLHEGLSAVASRLGAQDGLNVSNELGRVRHHGVIPIGGLADLIRGGRVEGERKKESCFSYLDCCPQICVLCGLSGVFLLQDEGALERYHCPEGRTHLTNELRVEKISLFHYFPWVYLTHLRTFNHFAENL